MDTITVLTFIGVAALVVLESFKLMSAFSNHKAHQEEREAMEILMQALEEGRVEGSKTDISIKGVNLKEDNEKKG